MDDRAVLLIYHLAEQFCIFQIPSMAYRVLTPNTECPSQSYIDDLVGEFESLDTENRIQHQNEHGVTRKGKQQRKRNKQRKSIGDESTEKNSEAGTKGAEAVVSKIERNLSIGSDMSGKSEDSILAIVEEINRQAEEDEKVKLQFVIL